MVEKTVWSFDGLKLRIGALTYFLSQKGDAGDDYRRLMVDLCFKF